MSIIRSKFTNTEDLGDNKYRSTHSISPVNVKRGGLYLPIDFDLKPGSGNSALEVSQLIDLRVPPRSVGPLVTFGLGDRIITIDLISKNNVNVILGGNNKEAIYPGILSNVDFHVVYVGHKVFLELHGDLRNRFFTFEINPVGVGYTRTPDVILFKDINGKVIFNFNLIFHVWKDPNEDTSQVIKGLSSVSNGKIQVLIETPDIVGLDRLR